MAFFIASFPSDRRTWISILIGLALGALSLFLAFKFGYIEQLEKFSDILFWIMFYFWWSIWAYVFISWIISKIFHTPQ